MRSRAEWLAVAVCLALPSAVWPGEPIVCDENDPPAAVSPAQASSRPWQALRSGWRNTRDDARYLLTFPARPTRTGVRRAATVAGGTVLLVLLDDEIRDHVQGERNATLDRWESRIEPLGKAQTTTIGALAVYASGRLIRNDEVAETGRCLIESLLFTEAFKSIGKGLTGRTPPGPGARASDFFDGGTIFPSGHTARAFAVAAVLSQRHGRVAAWIAYPLATLVGLARIESDIHWASDVLAGAALGHAIGRSISRRRAERRAHRSSVSLTPILSLDERRVSAGVRIRFP